MTGQNFALTHLQTCLGLCAAIAFRDREPYRPVPYRVHITPPTRTAGCSGYSTSTLPACWSHVTRPGYSRTFVLNRPGLPGRRLGGRVSVGGVGVPVQDARGVDSRLSAPLKAEFGEQGRHVVLDRLLGQEYPLAYLPVR